MTTKKLRLLIARIYGRISTTPADHVFLAVAIPFGLLFVFLTPPIAVVDEENHYFRALELSQGNLFTDKLNEGGAYGANIPENVAYYVYDNKGIALELNDKNVDDIAALGDQQPDETTLREVVYNASAAYSPAGYAPQALGMLIAALLQLPNDGYLYIGRLLNLALYIGVIFLAIRIIPIGKYILLVTALLPMSMYQAASLSMDATVVAAVLFLVSISVALALTGAKLLNKKIVAALVLATIVVALTKYVYLVAVLPILFYWVATLKPAVRNKGILLVVAAFGLAAIALVSWNAQLSPQVTSPATVLESGEKVISVTGQVEYILTHPFQYAKSVADLFFFDSAGADVGVRGIVGRFGWRGADYFAPLVSVVIAAMGLLLAVVVDRFERKKMLRKSPGSIRFGLLLVGLSIVGVLGIVTALYVAFTSVGDAAILGVQGRYFIPLLPLALIGLSLFKPLFIESINLSGARILLCGLVVFNLLYAGAKILELYRF